MNTNTVSPSTLSPLGGQWSRSSHGGSNSVAENPAKMKKINNEDEVDSYDIQVLNAPAKGSMKGLLLGDTSKDFPQSHSEVEGPMGHDVKFNVEQQRPDHECGFFVDDLIRELDYDLADRSGLQLMVMVDGDPDFDCGFYVEDFFRTLDAAQS